MAGAGIFQHPIKCLGGHQIFRKGGEPVRDLLNDPAVTISLLTENTIVTIVNI